MIEAAMIWNDESVRVRGGAAHDAEEASLAGRITVAAAGAIAAEDAHVTKVLGGFSPNDVKLLETMKGSGALDGVEAVAVHGFPLDWSPWQIQDWPLKLEDVRAATELPVWVSAVGVSSFGADEVQIWGLQRSAELLIGRAPRVWWSSLYDLPQDVEEVGADRGAASGPGYDRQFHMGLLREDGSPKASLEQFAAFTPALGLVQDFSFDDHRVEDGVEWMKRLGVHYLRTSLSLADGDRPDALRWFDRLMEALAEFELTVTFRLTPAYGSAAPRGLGSPLAPERFAGFCAAMMRRYGGGTRSVPKLRADMPAFTVG